VGWGIVAGILLFLCLQKILEISNPEINAAQKELDNKYARAFPEMGATDIIVAKIYRFCQLSYHSRGFFLGYRFLNPQGLALIDFLGRGLWEGGRVETFC